MSPLEMGPTTLARADDEANLPLTTVSTDALSVGHRSYTSSSTSTSVDVETSVGHHHLELLQHQLAQLQQQHDQLKRDHQTQRRLLLRNQQLSKQQHQQHPRAHQSPRTVATTAEERFRHSHMTWPKKGAVFGSSAPKSPSAILAASHFTTPSGAPPAGGSVTSSTCSLGNFARPTSASQQRALKAKDNRVVDDAPSSVHAQRKVPPSPAKNSSPAKTTVSSGSSRRLTLPSTASAMRSRPQSLRSGSTELVDLSSPPLPPPPGVVSPPLPPSVRAAHCLDWEAITTATKGRTLLPVGDGDLSPCYVYPPERPFVLLPPRTSPDFSSSLFPSSAVASSSMTVAAARPPEETCPRVNANYAPETSDSGVLLSALPAAVTPGGPSPRNFLRLLRKQAPRPPPFPTPTHRALPADSSHDDVTSRDDVTSSAAFLAVTDADSTDSPTSAAVPAVVSLQSVPLMAIAFSNAARGADASSGTTTATAAMATTTTTPRCNVVAPPVSSASSPAAGIANIPPPPRAAPSLAARLTSPASSGNGVAPTCASHSLSSALLATPQSLRSAPSLASRLPTHSDHHLWPQQHLHDQLQPRPRAQGPAVAWSHAPFSAVHASPPDISNHLAAIADADSAVKAANSTLASSWALSSRLHSRLLSQSQSQSQSHGATVAARGSGTCGEPVGAGDADSDHPLSMFEELDLSNTLVTKRVLSHLNEKIDKLYSWHCLTMEVASKQQEEINFLRSEVLRLNHVTETLLAEDQLDNVAADASGDTHAGNSLE